MVKISFSNLFPGDVINVTWPGNGGVGGEVMGEVEVMQVPPSFFDFPPIISISGVREVERGGGGGGEEVCWVLGVGREGGRGMEYDVGESDDELLEYLEVKGGRRVGGDGEVCLREGWAVGGGEYELVVKGKGRLGGVEGRASLSFVVRPPIELRYIEPRQHQRQQQLPCDTLWDNNPFLVYGVKTYPSGDVYLPFSVRGEGLEVMVKGVVGCKEVDMTKEMYFDNSTITWRFVKVIEYFIVILSSFSFYNSSRFLNQEGKGVPPAQDYSLGTRLRLSSSFLSSHFPPLDPVVVEVAVDLGEKEGERVFSSVFSFRFVPGDVDMSLKDDPGFVKFYF